MKLVVLMSLVAAAISRPPPCDDYCRTMWFSTQLPPPWDPLCDCAKRPSKLSSKTFNGKPVYTATTIFKLDDTGIYFDPANMHQVDGVTYINQPFYIVNSIDDFLTKPPITANIKASAGIYAGQQNTELKTVKYKRKYNVNLSDSNTHKSFSYSYRKDDVPQVKTDHKTMDPGSTEDLRNMGLSKCVDLYMMTVSRIYNNGSELAKIWGKSKYHKFSKLSDEDLIVTMQQECNETEDFVKKSIEEIKDKQPRNKVNPDNEGPTQAKQNKPFLEPNYTAKAESLDIKSEKFGRGDNFKSSASLGLEEINPFPIPPTDTTDASAPLSDELKPPTPAQNPTTLDTTSEIETKFINRAHENYPNSTIAAQDGLESATNIINVKNRPTYNNKEVAPQRVITREFANDVVSVINGTEDLQRDDTIDGPNGDTDNPLNVSPIGPPVTVYRKKNKVDIDDKQIPSITGNLYFRFGEDYIPAKFVQKSDGKLHVAIDGETICANLNKEGDSKSPVLTGLCNKFLNGQNN